MRSDVPPYSLVMIKPLTVGRKHAPPILEMILNKCPVSLRYFREWEICATTWRALYPDKEVAASNILTSLPGIGRNAWILLFTHKDRVSDPYPFLLDTIDPPEWSANSIRSIWRTRTSTPHKSDNVVHLSSPGRVSLEASLLFRNFNELDI